MRGDLSIFCDESGDFGPHSKYYLLSLVFHDQAKSIKDPISHITNFLEHLQPNNINVIHTYPLIRKEHIYRHLPLTDRQKQFDALVAFMRHSQISTKTIIIEKKKINNSLENTLKDKLSEILSSLFDEISKYKNVNIYYDRGQRQVSKILFDAFINYFDNVSFRTINPKDYFLFQVADLTCTLGLLNLKTPNLNKDEKEFFGSPRRLKKNYLRVLYSKRL